jgi:pyrroline-5-carboxylate reductase
VAGTGGGIGVIGAGAMARALVTGWLRGRRQLAAGEVWVCNRSRDDRLAAMAALGAEVTRDKAAICRAAAVLVLAVKPADAAAALGELAPHLDPQRHLLLSLVAGWPTAAIAARLGPAAGRVPLVRAMSNTPSAVGAGATAVAAGPTAGPRHVAAAAELLGAVGDVVVVDEADLAAVTAVSGSGPAYVFTLLEALQEAAVRLGLAPEVGRRLALQTLLGAAHLARQSGEAPADLTRQVASPGGTTAAALEVLRARGFVPTLVEAVARAARRAEELAAEAARA